jgi:hypothetical protein
VAVEDVVTQHQRHGVITNEILADDEGLGQALGPRLHGVGEHDA